jgi:hypothetical protein
MGLFSKGSSFNPNSGKKDVIVELTETLAKRRAATSDEAEQALNSRVAEKIQREKDEARRKHEQQQRQSHKRR